MSAKDASGHIKILKNIAIVLLIIMLSTVMLPCINIVSYGSQYREQTKVEEIDEINYPGYKELIKESEYCYCFYCKKQFESKEVVKYLEGENTALCPHCGIDAIIPNNVDEPIDNELIEGMNKYWF